MSTQVQYRRGTATENNAFTGALAEITVDTTNWTLRVQDGTTVGGYTLASLTANQTLTNKTLSAPTFTGTATGTANITLTGTVTATTLAGTLSTAAQTNITSVGTLGSLAVTGNTASGNFIGTLNGSGANVTSISATNISSGTLAQARLANSAVTLGSTALTLGGTVTTVAGLSSVTSTTFVGALTGAATTAGTVTTTAQPNITSVGTLTSVTVTGNTTSGNLLTAGLISAGGNVTAANFVTSGSSGNISGANVISATTFTATGNVTGGGITLSGNTISSTGSTLTIDPSAAGSTGNVIIAGNLSVQGTTTTYDSTTVTINDLLFSVANNAATASAANGGGIEVGPAGAAYAQWTYDQPNGRWSTALGINATGNITGGNLSGTSIVGTLTTAAQTNITSVGTLGSLAVTGNTTSGNLLTGGLISAAGQVTGSQFNGSGAGLTSIPGANVTGTVANATNATTATTAGTVTTAAQGNITSVGTLTSLAVSGAIAVGTGITNSGANGTGNIGSSTTYFNTVFAKATSAQYADLAENYAADAEYQPGTVVIFGGAKEITISSQSHDTRVAGIVSTDPAYLMNSGLKETAVALTGRLPCFVLGPVSKGDVLVTSSIPGVAQRIGNHWQPGCVIGKSLGDISGNTTELIEVVVGRF